MVLKTLFQMIEVSINLIIFLIELTLDIAYRCIIQILPLPKKDISNDIVLVTGAASGIGRLMAYKFAKSGAKLIVCWDLNTEQNQETAKTIEANGYGKAIAVTANIAERKEVAEAAATTRKLIIEKLSDKNAYVSILVNNAGIVTGKTLLNSSDKLNQLTMDVNATGHMWTLKEFLPDMIKFDKGHVCTIASLAGQGGVSGLLDYCASKHAAVGLSESLYMEMQKDKRNINVTCICPYFISTGMFEGVSNAYDWLLPLIKPTEMASIIVDSIRQNKQVVIHPKILYLLVVLKPVMNYKMYIKAVNLLKCNEAMDTWVGRVNQNTLLEKTRKE